MGRDAPGRGLRVPPPMTLASILERRFGVLEGEARRLAVELLAPAVASSDPAAVEVALLEIERRLEEVVADRDIEAAAHDAAARVSKHHRRLFFAALGAAIGMKVLGGDEVATQAQAPTGPAVALLKKQSRKGVLVAKLSAEPRLLADQFARRNAALIRSLRSEVVPALRDEVVRAVEFGISPEEAAERLRQKWARQGVPIARGNMKPRLELIARDQIAKLNTEITKARHRAAGIEGFRWRSKRDSRVRPLHRQLDAGGEVYTWASGHPTEGFPGEPVNCRCFAEAVVDHEAVMRAPGFIHLSTAQAAFAA